MPKMTGARFVAETLKGYGVTHVFFMQGVLVKALVEMGKLGIRPILTHGEKAAAYMADGYARASHRPGICLAQSVGAANLASGLQDAYLALSPVIAMTGRRKFGQRYRHAYQEIEHAPLFEPVTKLNVAVETLEQLPLLLRQAFREATSGAPGPVHLDLQGIFGEAVMDAEAELEVKVEEQFSHLPAFRPQPDSKLVQEAAAVLAKAKKPVIVAGGGVICSQSQKEVVQLAEMLSIPVATSLRGRCTISESHPLSVGVVGSYSRRCANRVVCEADLVLFIGSHTGSQVTHDWRIPRADTPVIQIDIDPVELGRNYPTEVAILGDAKIAVQRLIEALKPAPKNTRWLERVHELVSEWRSEVEPLRNSDAVPIRPERICKEITEFLPSDGVLVSDTGHAALWTCMMADIKQTGQCFIPCAGSLGWGFPGALGVKCAVPERTVICFTGDGGLWYHIAELETALRYNINTVTVINNNHSLNQIAESYTDQPSTDALWQFLDIDFAKIAQTMGCFGVRVTHPGDLREALKEASASGKPAVIDVVSDIKAVAPWGWV